MNNLINNPKHKVEDRDRPSNTTSYHDDVCFDETNGVKED